MITLKFEDGNQSEPVVVGPAPWFRVAGNFVRQGPHGSIVGSFRNHYWEIHSRALIRYFCEESSVVRFEDSLGGVGVRLGPISKLWVEDGVLHADDVLKAKFHEQSQLWHVYHTDTYWPGNGDRISTDLHRGLERRALLPNSGHIAHRILYN
jgi:hypothetical protein